MQEMISPMRQPVSTEGSAAISTTVNSARRWEQPAARAVEEKMLWSAAAMGMGARARLMRIVFPAALPEIVVGIRTGLVLALITMVTSEMIARKQGVGDILFNALAMAQYETVYATIVIIGLMGFAIDAGFERLRPHLVGWADPVHEIAVGST